MAHVSVVQHGGQSIVRTQFPERLDLAGWRAVIAETASAYAQQTAGKILALCVFEPQDFDEMVINLLEAVARANASVVKATAFLGVEGPQRALFNAMISITGRRGQLFSKEAEALDYLVQAAVDSGTPEGL